MNVTIQTVHFDADSKLIELIQKKINKLSNFIERIVDVNVFLKLNNLSHHIKDKSVEIRVHAPRIDFFVKTTSKSFETAFEEAFDSLVNQIKHKKEKQLN